MSRISVKTSPTPLARAGSSWIFVRPWILTSSLLPGRLCSLPSLCARPGRVVSLPLRRCVAFQRSASPISAVSHASVGLSQACLVLTSFGSWRRSSTPWRHSRTLSPRAFILCSYPLRSHGASSRAVLSASAFRSRSRSYVPKPAPIRRGVDLAQRGWLPPGSTGAHPSLSHPLWPTCLSSRAPGVSGVCERRSASLSAHASRCACWFAPSWLVRIHLTPQRLDGAVVTKQAKPTRKCWSRITLRSAPAAKLIRMKACVFSRKECQKGHKHRARLERTPRLIMARSLAIV